MSPLYAGCDGVDGAEAVGILAMVWATTLFAGADTAWIALTTAALFEAALFAMAADCVLFEPSNAARMVPNEATFDVAESSALEASDELSELPDAAEYDAYEPLGSVLAVLDETGSVLILDVLASVLEVDAVAADCERK